jgi:CBS domain-containing protein
MPKDLVRDAMTRDPVVLEGSTPVARALQVAHERQVHHLVLERESGLVAVVCLCDVLGTAESPPAPGAGEQRKIAACREGPTWVVAPDETLDDAASLMSREGIGCLPVVDNGRVVGVLSRRDLGRTGHAYAAALDARCAACGAPGDVRRLAPGRAGFCTACWEVVEETRADAETGWGD